MPSRNTLTLIKLAIALFVASAVSLGGFAVLRLERLTSQPQSFDLDLDVALAIDPSLMRFRQVSQIPLQVESPHALAVGLDGRICVAGESSLDVYQADGPREATFALKAPAKCLAVGGPDHVHPGRLYVGAKSHVAVLKPDGAEAAVWNVFGPKAELTSISLTDEEIFVADAGNRVVLRLGPDGEIRGKITSENDFVIPSPYFDVVASVDGLVRVVNPGARRIEVYSWAGEDMKAPWGKAGSEIASFFGCCNPSHLARLKDGRFVTSEKGVPRIKTYSSDGNFDGVVAAPEQLGISKRALGDPRVTDQLGGYDIATDAMGRVLVLDPSGRFVRVFAEIATPSVGAS